MVKFGTGGWRAVIGDEFIRSNIELLARAMAVKMKREGVADKGIILGYDRRFLSKETMRWCGSVFAAEGIRAMLVNRAAPTPLVMFYVQQHNLPYGMMVTASHNPAIYNGIKVFTAGGRDASQEQTAEIEAIASEIEGEEIRRMEYPDAVETGLIEEVYPLNEYLDDILEKINVAAIRHRNLRVALDPMYGVSEIPLKTLLLTSRCDITTIHDNHDTLFGGKMPAPSERTLRYLIATVMDYPFDIGIATDGDADRLGVIDDTGRYLTPNDVLVLLYYYLVKYKGWNGPVVRNVSTTHMLDKVAERFGQTCHEVPVGFKYISAKMQETNAVLGGESSGGLTVRGHINGKDGIYAAMLLIEMIAVSGEKAFGDLSRYNRGMRADFHGGTILFLRSVPQAGTGTEDGQSGRVSGAAFRDGEYRLSGWLQNPAEKRRMDQLQIFRHGAAAAHFLRDAPQRGCSAFVRDIRRLSGTGRYAWQRACLKKTEQPRDGKYKGKGESTEKL